MKKSPLPPELLQRCRDLRQRATNAEQMLWQLLRDRQIAGKKFRRQHPLRGYILDFYCHEARLVIELDGSGHSEPTQATYDAKRTQVLQAEGMSVLRFWNNQVFENIEGVLEAIWMALTRPSPKGRGSKIVNSPRPLGESAGGEGEPAIFWRFAEAGAKLAQLHLNYETAAEYGLTWIENREVPFSWRVAKMKLSSDKTQLIINQSLTLASIPPACFRYRLGNRSALEWVIDQYQISTDKRSQITSDPNRADDGEYIVRLVGRVITVSIETMQIIDIFPAWETTAIANE